MKPIYMSYCVAYLLLTVSVLALGAENTSHLELLPQAALTTTHLTALSATPRRPAVLIFVSFSMPKSSLISWLISAKRIHAQVSLRGLVGNSFKKTLRRLYPLAQATGQGIVLDPVAFSRFHITQVPAVVVTAIPTHCSVGMSCMTTPCSVVYGNVSLRYALQTVANHGDTETAPIAAQILKLLDSISE